MSRHTTPEPFKINVADAVLTDLRERLDERRVADIIASVRAEHEVLIGMRSGRAGTGLGP